MKTKTLYLGILALLLVMPFASAFGVSSPYWKDNPLVMYPGETKDVSLNIQNMAGTNDLTIRVNLASGTEIAKITDYSSDYSVKAGTKDTYVHMLVQIPEDAKIGSTYGITVSFATVTSGSGGGVAIGTAMDRSFSVIVGEKSETGKAVLPSPVSATTIVIIAALIIIIVAAILMKKKGRK